MLGSTLGRRKVRETFPKSAGCTLGEQKRPKVLPMGFGASLKCIVPKNIEYCSFYGAYFVDRLYLPNIESLDRTAFIRIVADEVFLGPKLKTTDLGGMEVNRVIIDESHPQI